MSSFGISQLNLSGQLALAIANGQRQLNQAQVEVNSGRHADMGLTLGAGIRGDLLWRIELSGLQQISGSNKLAQNRAKLTEDSLKKIADLAASFISNLAGARTAGNGQQLAAQAAAAAYAQFVSLADTTYNGQYLFAGINSRQPPIAPYAGSAAQTAVASAFQSTFGFPPSDTMAQSISPAAMQTFLDGPYADLFQPVQWQASWSAAADTGLQTRIGISDTVSATTTANIAPFRQLAQAFTMIADLGAPGLSQATFQQTATDAMALASSAQAGLADEQSRLGLAQAAITAANDTIDQRITALTRNIETAESVDRYEVASRVNALMTQLETSYSLTGRISQLSLLKFI